MDVLSTVMVPMTWKRIVSSGNAMATAFRKDPEPLSKRFVTWMTDCADMEQAQLKSVQRRNGRRIRVMLSGTN